MINVIQMDSIPPNSNPFNHDFFNMGMNLGTNVLVMFSEHIDCVQPYIVVINTLTGERVRLNFEES